MPGRTPPFFIPATKPDSQVHRAIYQIFIAVTAAPYAGTRKAVPKLPPSAFGWRQRTCAIPVCHAAAVTGGEAKTQNTMKAIVAS
ncbi:hypothetical protein LTR95_015540 [Oleoguttula sp. CCFEE 5521]